LCADGRTAVPGSARRSIACIGADGSGGVHLAHAVIADIGDVELPSPSAAKPPIGDESMASVAGPASPEKPVVPGPATVFNTL
jgi:hypothetical protein